MRCTGLRLLVLLAAMGVAAPVAASATHPRHEAAARRLNVVLILSDDERSDGTMVMRNTQRLLADHGVTFTDFHVTTSLCGPSRASILTGLYSHHTGVITNFGPHGFPEFDQTSDLGVWLHDAGYDTALVGKYINDYTAYGTPRSRPAGTTGR